MIYVLVILTGWIVTRIIKNRRAGVGSDLGNLGAPDLSPVQAVVFNAARAWGVDPSLELAVVEHESGFNPAAVNSSDPSYGLGQVMRFWLKFFNYKDDTTQLLDAQFNANITARILLYFQSKGFKLPDQIDIYNVGETLWRKGTRNASYRNHVVELYNKWKSIL